MHPHAAPVLLKTADWNWPEEPGRFHLASRNGLVLCRNTPLFRSSVPVNTGDMLAHHAHASLPDAPIFDGESFGQMIGFFAAVACRHEGAEALALLCCDAERRIVLVVPRQTTTVIAGHARGLGLRVQYDIPILPPELTLCGTAHSHGFEPAFQSAVDDRDTDGFAGLHLVAGQLNRTEPSLDAVIAVDGARFRIRRPWELVRDYAGARPFPPEWMNQVTVERLCVQATLFPATPEAP